MDPRFLDMAEVLEVHRDQIERYGGSDGIRSLPLLQSAVAMPSAGFAGQFFHGDLLEMAAAYLFHITCNHPFVDGNKRTGAASALTFLDLNGVRLDVADDVLASLVEGVAKSEVPKSEVAVFLRNHVSA